MKETRLTLHTKPCPHPLCHFCVYSCFCPRRFSIFWRVACCREAVMRVLMFAVTQHILVKDDLLCIPTLSRGDLPDILEAAVLFSTEKILGMLLDFYEEDATSLVILCCETHQVSKAMTLADKTRSHNIARAAEALLHRTDPIAWRIYFEVFICYQSSRFMSEPTKRVYYNIIYGGNVITGLLEQIIVLTILEKKRAEKLYSTSIVTRYEQLKEFLFFILDSMAVDYTTKFEYINVARMIGRYVVFDWRLVVVLLFVYEEREGLFHWWNRDIFSKYSQIPFFAFCQHWKIVKSNNGQRYSSTSLLEHPTSRMNIDGCLSLMEELLAKYPETEIDGVSFIYVQMQPPRDHVAPLLEFLEQYIDCSVLVDSIVKCSYNPSLKIYMEERYPEKEFTNNSR